MKQIILFSFLILVSCGIHRYATNEHKNYSRFLSTTELDSINEGYTIQKSWHGENKRGDFSIGTLKVKKGNEYKLDFIEIGEWRQLGRVFCSAKVDSIKEFTTYDSYGNIIKSHLHYFSNKRNEWYLNQSIDSKIIHEGDSIIPIQDVKVYHSNGRLNAHMMFYLLDYTMLRSDELKRKLFLQDSSVFFNSSGDKITSDEYNSKIITWYSIPLKMKK